MLISSKLNNSSHKEQHPVNQGELPPLYFKSSICANSVGMKGHY